MNDLNFTLPQTDWSIITPFLEACRKEELKFPRCSHCSRWQWYPIYDCPSCGGNSFEWVSVSKKATLFSWTVVRKPFFPEFADRIPLIVAIADMDDAPGVRLISNIIHCNPEDLSVGQKLEVVFEHMTEEVSLPKFIFSR